MKLSNPFPNEVLNLLPLSNLSGVNSRWVYPGGEVGVRVNVEDWSLRGMFRIQSAEDIIAFKMVLDAIEQNNGVPPVNLMIPYIPYARQDRVATKGDPLAIGVFARLIHYPALAHVWCLDPHSSETENQFLRTGVAFHGASPAFFIEQYINKVAPGKKVVLVSPDKGAEQKTIRYLEDIDNAIGVIVCRKTREPVTGRLTQAEFDRYIPKNIGECLNIKDDPNIELIVTDDICDGGRTFMNLVELLDFEGFKNPVHLWTSHAIYSYGIDGLLKKFKTIGSTNSFLHKHNHANLITIPLDQQ